MGAIKSRLEPPGAI